MTDHTMTDRVSGAPVPPATLDALLSVSVARAPRALAVVAPGRAPLDFASLCEEVGVVRAALAAAGLTGTGRVAVALPQGPEMAVAVLGVAAAAVCVPLNPGWRAGELATYLAETGARAVLVRRGDGSAAREAARASNLGLLELAVPDGAPAGRFTLEVLAPGTTRAGAAGSAGGLAGARPDRVALVLPTSGTTSRPKRVPLSHANLCASAHAIARTLALEPADRALIVMPLFHIHGLMMWLATLASGGTAACPPAFDAARFAAWLEELCPTCFFELGGHSLPALQMLACVQEHFGVELDLRLVFDAPTVAALATAIDGRNPARAKGDDLDRIVEALATLEDEQVRRIIGARADRDTG